MIDDARESMRSTVFSILKCEYGWNGCFSPEMRDLDGIALAGIDAGKTPIQCAHECAIEIHRVVGQKYFRQRIDGRPNRRTVPSLTGVPSPDNP